MSRLILHKMLSEYRSHPTVQYFLRFGTELECVNNSIGKKLVIEATGTIFCLACSRKTSKSFHQGYCFPCMKKLARCDSCIIKPELCHFHNGTCREPEWGQQHCMIPHLIYLANSSGIKVGITRAHQAITRWIDQGAIQAIPIGLVKNRLESGVIEVILKQNFPDKTNWRTMLKGNIEFLDLSDARQEAIDLLPIHPFVEVQASDPLTIDYPVLAYPKSIKSFNLDEQRKLEGTLLGIKGQYLILDTGVINLRSFGGYEVDWQV